jgi:hypothetical protein
MPGNAFVAGLPPANCEMEIGLLHLPQKATGISFSFFLQGPRHPKPNRIPRA